MVLEGYKQYKKTFTNPLESSLGGVIQKTSYLDDTLPNILWIAFLYVNTNLSEASMFVSKISKALNIRGFMSEMYDISCEKVKKELTEDELKKIKDLFLDFITIYPRSPLIKLYTQQELDGYRRIFENSLIKIQKVAIHLDNKYSELTIITLGILINSLVKNNKLSGIDEKYLNLNNLESNIQNDDIKGEFGGVYRSSIQIILMLDEKSKKWSEYFWNVGKNTNCNDLEKLFGEEIKYLFEDEDYSITTDDLNYIINTNKLSQNIFFLKINLIQ